GMILRDNVYGTLEEDVQRRDFTVNALYYTVKNFEVTDYVNGIADLKKRELRMIGDPEQRYREDPVRVLRAIRLSAKLDFSIEEETAHPISDLAPMLESIPAARLFDEILKLFFAGQSLKTYKLLKQHNVFLYLFPASARIIESGETSDKLLLEAFTSTDNRIRDLKSITPAFLLAAILWPALQQEFIANKNRRMPPMVAMHQAAQTVISNQVERISIPKRFSIAMREIWEFQLRLSRRQRANALLANKRFRAAYDFILLREKSGEDLQGIGQWWTEYQEADADVRHRMLNKIHQGSQHSKSRKRRVKSTKTQQKGTR
ncbi:MAG: polynucleotide adenylyltransferase PcnB, partial [Pseudohongiellaceae bacterium]